MPLVLSGTSGISTNGTNWALQPQSGGQVVKPNHPAFGAGRNSATGSGIIVWDLVLVNTNSGYNSSTGRFTAPVAGNYFFSFGWLPNAVSGIAWWLRKNGSQLPASMVYNNNVDQHGSISVVIPLAVNDYVDVYANGGDGSEGGHCNFCGFLIG